MFAWQQMWEVSYSFPHLGRRLREVNTTLRQIVSATLAFPAHAQHRPLAECGPENGDNSDDENDEGKDDVADDDDGDETADDQLPMTSDTKHTGTPGVKPPPGGQRQKGDTTDDNGGGQVEGLATDAQLSCPLCFTTVCLECQRHAKYLNQFRAVTGINVNVKHEEFLTLDQVSGGGGGRRKGGRKSHGKSAAARHNGGGDGVGAGNRPPGGNEEVDRGGVGAGEEEEEMFHPVCCGECDHIVGVYDAEEVFHFFGVIASG